MANDVLLLGIIVFGIISLLSLFHVAGILGEGLSSVLFGLMGALAYVFPFYLIVASGLFIANPNKDDLRRKILMSTGVFWCFCGLFQWVVNDQVNSVFDIYTICSDNQGGGGFLGGLLAFELARYIGRAGAIILILAILILFIMLITGKQIITAIADLYQPEDRDDYVPEDDFEYSDYRSQESNSKNSPMPTYTFDKEKAKPKAEKKKKPRQQMREIEPEVTKEEPVADQINIIRPDQPSSQDAPPLYQEELDRKFGKKKETKATSKKARESLDKPQDLPASQEARTPTKAAEKVKITEEDQKEMSKLQEDLSQASQKEIPYAFPPMTLLGRPQSNQASMGDRELKETAMKLKSTLESFGVNVSMGDISLGPSVTRYELIPAQGVKVSKITSLSDDIKLALAASDIRIEAPIPGKAAVGIEVPNTKRSTITLRELLESDEFKKAKSKVTFAVGKDISGKTIVTDIAKMPHLLIAGATGSGKSVLINTLIMSIIYKANPNEVKMIMVDPKMVELAAYEGIPHLMIPVVKDPKKASAALAWAVAEMTTRYQKFAEAGVRDLASYNVKMDRLTKKDDPNYQRMPQIVIIVDEFADLMMVAPGEVEDAVCRLAQLARAAGIHLVLATQRPSVNVITGLIKANIPSRIALSVSSGVDSRTIIDSVGAEKLLGNGDMLFAPQNLPNPIRVQGAFVSDDERDGVVSFLKNNSNGPSYNEEVTK
ncbi:MAG: DNA translocase FtsK, partial [Eubacterium sp.]|nr:DNA translocase FtsK [Eubacterium sp.]